MYASSLEPSWSSRPTSFFIDLLNMEKTDSDRRHDDNLVSFKALDNTQILLEVEAGEDDNAATAVGSRLRDDYKAVEMT
jgi:hypothetical protein